MGRLFGTDGARGIAVTELTCDLAMDIGRAAAVVLTRHIVKNAGRRFKILVGKDTRISGDILESALCAGIASVGVDAYRLGIVPTPAVAYLVGEYGADAGVMISASHNAVQYNGIKLFGGIGFKLPDDIEDEIETLVLDNRDELLKELRSGTKPGQIVSADSAHEKYAEHIIGIATEQTERPFEGLSVVFDCANGSAAVTAGQIFSRLGAECTIIGGVPTGMNINKNCGSTHIEHLSKAVVGLGCDIGIAFDGDADRCLAVDEAGGIIDGDKIIALLSVFMKQQGVLNKNTAVVTVMSNMGFHAFMRENGIATVCTKVGDRYVLEEMLEKGYNLGGEQSGHIIFLDEGRHVTTGDGQLTAVKLLQLAAAAKGQGKTMSQYVRGIPDFPQLLYNVEITPQKRGNWESGNVKSVIKQAEAALGMNGRVLVRESGTEPLLRIMTEGEDADTVADWTARIAEAVKAEL